MRIAQNTRENKTRQATISIGPAGANTRKYAGMKPHNPYALTA